MIIAIPVTPAGQVGHSWGRAGAIGIARVQDGQASAWTVHEVRWDLAHDEGSEGQHHARVVRFLQEHGVTHVLAHHMGPGMARTLERLEIPVIEPDSVDALEAVQHFAAAEG